MKPFTHPTDSQDAPFLDGQDSLVSKSDVEVADRLQNRLAELKVIEQAKPLRDKSWRRRRQIAVLMVLAILIASGSFAYFRVTKDKSSIASGSSATLAPVVTVTTVPVTIRPVENVLTVTGTVSPWDELNIGAEQGGSGLRIDSVNFDEGDLVKKGQVLVKLNSAPLEANLAELKALLDQNKAKLVKAITPLLPEDLAGLKAQVAHDDDLVTQAEAFKRQQEEKLKYADINVERYKMLANEGAKSDSDFEEKEAAQKDVELELISAKHKVEAARRTADQSREKLVLAQKGGRIEDVAISRADIEQNQARIKNLNEQIKETVISAPDDGLIVKRTAHLGDICAANMPLLTMVRLNRLELKAQANDTDLQKFKPGQTVTVYAGDAKSTHVTGTVRLVSPQVDSTSRLGIVHVDLPENSGLKSGMFVRGEILLSSLSALTVPINSVVTRASESVVFKLNGNRVVSTPVVTGAEAGAFIEIKSGLTAGQQIVDKGARFLSDRDVVDLAH